MFSEYASRFMHQSQLRLSSYHNQAQHPKPLFHSTVEIRDDYRESLALRQSRAGISGRFGAFRAIDPEDEQEEFEGDDHAAMRSSWRPPDSQAVHHKIVTPQRIRSGSQSSETDNENGALDESVHASVIDSNASITHSEAPDDIMFGVPLDDSIASESVPEQEGKEHEDTQAVKTPHSLASRPLPPTLEEPEFLENSATPDVLSDGNQSLVHHDAGYAILFMLVQASSIASSIFIYLRTDIPSTPVVDSIYAAVSSSMGLIFKDLFIATIVAGLWLFAMRTCAKPLLYTAIIAVPVVFVILGFYSLVWSYKGLYGGYELQARAMRWSAFAFVAFASGWTYAATKRRHAFTRAVDIIKLSCLVLEKNPYLTIMSLGNSLLFLVYSFIWLHQFERVFLRGSLQNISGTTRWLLERDSWALGAYMVLIYLWSFGVYSGVQRAAISAVVSRWYFHRHEIPAIPQLDIVKGAYVHATSTSFGSICGSSLVSLLTRLPLLMLPRRLTAFISIAAYYLASAPVLHLTNPLTLSFAVIHSIDIAQASRTIMSLRLGDSSNGVTAYRTAKMLLSATRTTTALGLGTAAWISSSRSEQNKGSLYGYVVGCVAAATAWAIVGSIEGMMSIIVDASFVCHKIDLPNSRQGRSHCQAADVFGSGTSDTTDRFLA